MWPFSSREPEVKKRKVDRPIDPNAEILAQLLADPPPGAERKREPDWIAPAEANAAPEARPYLQLGEGELERHAREEHLPEGEAGATVPGPSAVFQALISPLQALPEGVRHVVGAVLVFAMLGAGIQFVLKPVLVICGALDP